IRTESAMSKSHRSPTTRISSEVDLTVVRNDDQRFIHCEDFEAEILGSVFIRTTAKSFEPATARLPAHARLNQHRLTLATCRRCLQGFFRPPPFCAVGPPTLGAALCAS